MRCVKALSVVACSLAVVLGSGQVAQANVWAAHLNAPATWDSNSGPMTIEYRLNEPATNVTVEIFRASAPGTVVKTLTGTGNKGLNSVTWDGSKDGGGQAASASDYTFKVIAQDTTGHSAWTKISDEENTNSMKFYSAKGLDINKDQASSYFGRAYISESAGGTTGGRTTQTGLYAINNDGTDAIGQGDTARTLNAGFIGTFVSPWRLIVAPDGDVYVSDYSDPHSGVWKGNGNIDDSSGQEVLDSTGRDATGLCANHGSGCSVFVEGTGASRSVVTLDEDWTVPDPGGLILRYNIGNSTLPYTGTPTIEANLSANVIVSNVDARRDSAGKYYWTQYRWNADKPSFMKFVPNPGDPANPTIESSLTGTTYIYRGGLALNEPRGWIVLGCYYGDFEIRDMATPANKITTAQIGPNGYTTAVAVDPASNVWAVNSTTERCTVWSPPDNSNSFTTTYYATIDATIHAGDTTPPAILAAISTKNHGALAGDISILPYAVEDRTGGPTKVVVTFDENIQGAGGLDPTDVSVVSTDGSATISVSAVSIASATLTVEMSGATSPSKLSIAFGGIQDLAGNACTEKVCVGVVIGDVNNDSTVNIFDLVTVRNNLNAEVVAGNFRSDVNADNAVNIFDLVTIRNNLNADAGALSCP